MGFYLSRRPSSRARVTAWWRLVASSLRQIDFIHDLMVALKPTAISGGNAFILVFEHR
jgi:hypothetical protein